MAPTPMFPLGTVLFPGSVLPLHVFEPRYRALVRTVLDGAGTFGVVLIDRGSDVGGGDVRSAHGTLARVVEAAELDDGRWLLATVGVERFRVRRWLADDPHPWAELDPWPDAEVPPDLAPRHHDAVAALRRVLALRSELGDPAPPATVELHEDLVTAGYQACALAGLGPVDAQALLGAPDPGARTELLTRLLVDEAEVLTFRLGAS